MRIHSKLLLSAVIVFLSLSMVGGIGTVATTYVANISMQLVENEAIPISTINTLENSVWGIWQRLTWHTQVSEVERMQQLEQEIAQLEAEIPKQVKTLEDRYAIEGIGATVHLQTLQTFQTEWQQFRTITKQVLQLSRDFTKEDALQLILQGGQTTYNKVIRLLRQLLDDHRRDMETLREAALEARQQAAMTITTLTLIIGLGVLYLVNRFGRGLLTPLLSINSQLKLLAQGQLVGDEFEYQGTDEVAEIVGSARLLKRSMKSTIEDIVRVSQGLAVGNLRITPTAEYRGDFIQIRQALETALSDLKQVIEDIVQVSQGLAEGQQIMPKAEYRGDFVQIKTGLETAATKLAEATTRNATQDWLKTGQALLNEQLRGEQDVSTLAKNIITFLTPYVEAQVGVFYLLEEANEGVRESNYLKLIASYAYTQRKGLPTELPVGEGLVGQAALEQQFILVTDIPEDYIHIESGLGEAVPQTILVMPFLYENAVKGVIELGSFQVIRDLKIEFLKQVMPSIGIAVNTAESRTKMQALLQKVR